MKKINKLLIVFLSFFVLMPTISKASKKDQSAFVYGAGLNEGQIESVKKSLNVSQDEENIASVRGEDIKRYLGYYTEDYNLISSAKLVKKPQGSGIKVDILTPENINEITESQYTNAAITAGITDADISIASPIPVTGESALTGVYKAVELMGGEIYSERTQVAQEEIGSLKKISEENEDNPSFDTGKLDQAVAEVKGKLQEYKEENGQIADSNQIKIYIEDALNNVNMGDILSNNNIEILINYFEKYQETSAIDSKEVRENLKQFAKDFGQKGKKFYEDNKEEIDKVGEDIKESGLLDKIIAFFKDLFNSFFQSSQNSEN